MASCERCWSEAGGNVERYMRMVETRDALGHPCTPEEQAGPYAEECPKCGRKTVHQLCRVCMACGWTRGEPK
jgi:hypothetical protein